MLCAVTPGNLSGNLSHNFVASLQHNLHESYETFRCVTCHEMNLSHNVFAEVTVARSRIDFYFFATVVATKNCKMYLFQGMLYLATLRATSVLQKLPAKLQEELPSATATYEIRLQCI